MTIGAAQQFFLGASKATGGGAAGYQVERSLRFNSSDSGFLSRTPAVAGSRTTWTWAGWVKRSKFSGLRSTLFRVNYNGAIPETAISFTESAQVNVEALMFATYPSEILLMTQAVFRDTSAWYHIVCTLDTTNGTSTDRARMYVNGTRVTTFAGSTLYPSSSYQGGINSTDTHRIGGTGNANEYFDGYLADVHFIDGQALTPSSFTEVSATTGQLIPKTYTGTYGTNGFQLKFADNSSNTATTLGKDTSGNSNNWTPNNLSTTTGGPTSVAAASGALPIFNTTDTYGVVKGTGTRTDTNSASIVLALPMDGTNGGTSFGDQSAVIKGSGSAKTVTVNGNTNTSTAVSKFYGSSGYFDGAGDYLTCASSADLTVGTGAFTAECWVYTLAQSNAILFQNYDDNNSGWGLRIQDLGGSVNGVSNAGAIIGFTSGTLPTSSWSHVAAVWSATGSNCSVYINGVLKRTISNIPSTTQATFWIGAQGDSGPGVFFNGYIQDLRIYKGVAKYTGNFNPPSSTANATIAAGNDSLVDTPTSYGTDTGVGGEVRGNYCTLNPIDVFGSATFSDGNLQVIPAAGAFNAAFGTIPVKTGKWYWEITVSSDTSTGSMIGVTDYSVRASQRSWYSDSGTYGYLYYADGTKYTPGTPYTNSAYGSSFTTGAVIGVALDMDNGTATMYNNGASQGNIATGLTGKLIGPILGQGASTAGQPVLVANFGQRAFAYTAPSGFKALCDTNLPSPLIAKPNTLMDVALWTGTGVARSITGLAFSPDLIWIKQRSGSATAHSLEDIVRGTNKHLTSNGTDAEVDVTANGGGVTAFNSSGFSLGTWGAVNENNQTYVGWTWDGGTTTASNPDGSITSQVRANASAGFSVVTFTMVSSGSATVGHGLGVAPSLIIAKARTGGASNWGVFHSAVCTKDNFLYLNTTGALGSYTDIWGTAVPTSTVFGVNFNLIPASQDIVAYCFAPVVGYSSFGSYVGNGSSDGPMVYTGFRPKFILGKVSSTTDGWFMFDATRSPYNVANSYLAANASAAEATFTFADFLSNGFKLRATTSDWNASGQTYIYCAWAENPFQYARAR